MNALDCLLILVFLATIFAIFAILWPIKKPYIASLIEGMADYGFDLNCGAHMDGLTGYFAMFYKKDGDYCCEECGCCKGIWSDAGHADNLTDAITMAADIIMCLNTDVPSSEKFK